MLWVDHHSYFGPDRRVMPPGLRLRERRHENLAGAPPPLPTALRQLRTRVLDARGDGAKAFADRVQSLAVLAEHHHEHEAAKTLARLSRIAARGHQSDVRSALYSGLDRIHTQLRVYH